MRLNDEDRFWSKVSKGEGCWLWDGHLQPKGYGNFTVGNKTWKAHRFAWVLTFGAIADGLFVLHRCDNPTCVRPDHLFLGTNDDNMRDMVNKGRKQLLHPTCQRGHRLSPENTSIDRNGAYLKRRCKECHKQRQRAARLRQLAMPLTEATP